MSQDVIKLVPFADDYNVPVDIVQNGDDRLFIVEKGGRVQIIDTNGVKMSDPFIDIRSRVNSSASERGLLGMCFHPSYPDSGYFYMNYTRNDGATVISRFSVTTDPNVADPASELMILTVGQPFNNHNAGDLEFGPDGYLYIGLGDGGNAGDPGDRSQDPLNFLGKMLRIDIDNGDPYAIPADNPFADEDFTLDEIWALGLRNPWRYSFDRVTGDLYIADVGQDAWEEVNVQLAASPGGENYGWRCYEGSSVFNGAGCGDAGDYTFPAYAYSHQGFNCSGSITGGYVYRGQDNPDLYGKYILVDYCTGVFRSWSIADSSSEVILNSSEGIYTTFGEDAHGELYVASALGQIFKIEQTASNIRNLVYEELQIFPVPAKDAIHLTIEDWGHQELEIEIFNASGMLILNTISTPNAVISVADLPNGTYLLRAQAEDRYFTGKFSVLR